MINRIQPKPNFAKKPKIKQRSLEEFAPGGLVKTTKKTRGSSKINKENPWLFDNIPLTEIPTGMYGFVYEITNTETMKRYIGKKFFWSQVGTGKSAIIKESNWKSYWSSSDNVKADIETYGKEKLIRRILVICRDKRDVDLQEVRILWSRNVLGAKRLDGEPVYYNDNISGKYYRRQELFDDTARIYSADSHIHN